MKTPTSLILFVSLLLSNSCQRGKTDAPMPVAPPKLEPLTAPTLADANADDRVFEVSPYTARGLAIPSGALTLRLHGAPDSLPQLKEKTAVLLVPDEDTYIAQLAPLFAQLQDAKVPVWVQHSKNSLAFPVLLKDETQFQAWLDDVTPGKVRIIQRADGFELQTNMGKLPAGDKRGPSVPNRSGQMDLGQLQQGLLKVKGRFKEARELFVVPSHGTPLAQVADALSTNYLGEGPTPIFDELNLVYARVKAP
jgi:hypothetical protein